MPELSKDFVALLQYLAPGFVLAWVFYGLTSHIKPSQFERVVQALIFTVVVQAVVLFERAVAEALGEWVQLGGPWSSTTTLFGSLCTALILGIALSACVNADTFHSMLRRLGLSNRSAHPCEWFGIFTKYQRYVVLQLKDGTRIFGWPQIWPSEPDKGHFFLTRAMRVVGDEAQDLDALEGVLVDASEVSSVEFVKDIPEAL